jgi:methylenetetrahydrofolate reductase (NADPH)
MIFDSAITEAVDSGRFILTAGINSPKDTKLLAHTAEELAGNVNTVIVSDGNDAGMASLAACVHLQNAGIQPILELSTRDMNRIALESTIIGASSLGIKSIICTTGVHQTLTHTREARGVFDIDPIQLLLTAQKLRNGARMTAGTTTNPFANPMELHIFTLQKAVHAGAQFVITAPVFDIDRMSRWMELIRDRRLHEKLHIIAGVLPIETSAEALELREKYRWLDIPDKIIEKVNLDFTSEIVQKLVKMDGIRGIHIHPAREGCAKRLLDTSELSRKP